MLTFMTTNNLSPVGLSERHEPLLQSVGAAGLSEFANLIFLVVRQGEAPVIARATARSPSSQPRRQRGGSTTSAVQNIWCLDDILAAATTDDLTVESVLTELVIRQIHQPDAKEKPDDNPHASQQDSNLAL